MKNMKKNYYIITALFCSFSLYSTQIGIQMVSCVKDIQDVDMVAVGKNEQRILSGSIVRDYKVGSLHQEETTAIYLARTLNYGNLENVYEINKQIGVLVEKDLDFEKIVTITEPILDREIFWCAQENKVINQYVYQPRKKPSKRLMLKSSTFEIHGEKAFEEAKKDLIFCYHRALSFIAQQKKVRSIALLTLGIVTGFPWQVAVEIAVTSVREYIKKRPHDYTEIWLCTIKTVQDDSYQDNSHNQVYEKYWMELVKRD